MHILVALTYYRPHYSGLTVYAERLARSLAHRGHKVTVLTSRFNRHLPVREVLDGLEVIRLDVLMRVSKGVIMPGMPWQAWKLARQADVVNLHVPQLDAAGIALISRMLGKPVVLTYHCDLRLPSGAVHFVANQVSHIANAISATAANTIVTNTRDYAENSTFLHRFLPKIHPIFPPVELAAANDGDIAAFRRKAKIEPGERIIGMAARLATEKGVEYLVEALPSLLEKYPTARVLFMGQYQNVLGEDVYARKLAPLIESLGKHWTFLGTLSPSELTAFYHECEVTVLPSINSTESFGMVQIESMYCGTPVVASDIPGARQPVMLTGMGQVVPPADAAALAKAITDILDKPELYRKNPKQIMEEFSPNTIAARYESLFEQLRNETLALEPAGKQTEN